MVAMGTLQPLNPPRVSINASPVAHKQLMFLALQQVMFCNNVHMCTSYDTVINHMLSAGKKRQFSYLQLKYSTTEVFLAHTGAIQIRLLLLLFHSV